MRNRIGVVLSSLLMAGFIIPYNYQWLMPPPADMYRRMDTADITKALLLAPSDVQSLQATSAIKVNAPVVRIKSGTGGDVTLTSTPSIPDGIPGQLLIVQCTSTANPVTLQSETKLAGSNLALKDSTRQLLQDDALVLMFISPYPRYQNPPSTAAWYELAYSRDNTNLVVRGTLGALGQILMSSLTESTPGLAMSTDGNSGIYMPGNDTVCVVTNGTRKIEVSPTGTIKSPIFSGTTFIRTDGSFYADGGSIGTPSYTSVDANTGMYLPGADTVYVVCGGTAKLRVGPTVVIVYDGLQVGTGSASTPATAILHNAASLDFGNTAAQSSSDLTISVTGAADGNPVSLGVPNASVSANTAYTAWVSASNVVTVRFNNYSSGAIDPTGGTFYVEVTVL